MTPSPRVREDSVMPGPQDQLSEQRQADHVRPLERNPTVAALRERLERLPPNHPSSPRYDDGARKLSGEDAPRIHPDGSWEWKGYTLTPEQSRCADLALARCRDAEGRDADGNYGEHGLTPAMRRIEAQLEHAKLAPNTEKFALKTPDRFKQKLAEMIAVEPDKSAEELSNEISDGIRYTFLLDRDYYLTAMREISSNLEGSGFELGVRKNTWESEEYKGVNTRWLDSEGNVRFEVQFHTEQSFRIKQLTHDAYDRIHDLRTIVEEREELRDYQRTMSAEIIPPPGCENVLEFRKDGW
jgi:hypothetical protein